MAVSTWARRGGASRFPRQIVIMTDERQDEEVRAFALAVNGTVSEVAREAIAAGMPVLRKRAQHDGRLPLDPPEAVA